MMELSILRGSYVVIRIYTIYRMIYTIYRIEKAFLKSMSSRLRDGQVPLESSVFRGRDAFASRYFLYIRNGEMANSKQSIIHLQRKFSGRSFPAGWIPTSEQKTYSHYSTQSYSIHMYYMSPCSLQKHSLI